MAVTPSPVFSLLFPIGSLPIAMLFVALFPVSPICPIFLLVPLMPIVGIPIVIPLGFVVIVAAIIIGSDCYGHCQGNSQCRT